MAEEEVQALVHDVDLSTGTVTAVTRDGIKLSFNVDDVRLVDLSPKQLVKGKSIAVRHGLRRQVLSVADWSR
ncbi:MAG: hypothetical protein R3300_13010 [Candidatus Promineifilaceae bacterium]|nr:hypothetical protein [Candidatus Promineifilaceae bacterium]